ncbi:PH domain-containing protein [Virgibacillus pantothenticus]
MDGNSDLDVHCFVFSNVIHSNRRRKYNWDDFSNYLCLFCWSNLVSHAIYHKTQTINYTICEWMKQTINIKDIRSIRKTTNPFVAPSLSIRRIEISYDQYKTVQISPKEKSAFIKQLKEIHSEIACKKEG